LSAHKDAPFVLSTKVAKRRVSERKIRKKPFFIDRYACLYERKKNRKTNFLFMRIFLRLFVIKIQKSDDKRLTIFEKTIIIYETIIFFDTLKSKNNKNKAV